jgi:hypothetical protein
MRYSSTPPGSIVQSPSEQPTISHWQSLVSNESVQSAIFLEHVGVGMALTLWFAVIAVIGVLQISEAPRVL